MRKRICLLAAVLLMSLTIRPGEGRAQNYVQVFSGGRIDWTNGIVEGSGRGLPPDNPANPAQARSVAEAEAIRVARCGLLEIIKGVPVDFRTVTRQMFAQREGILNGLNSLLKNAEVVNVAYLEDGSVEATVAMKLHGPFAELILPQSIRTINPVQQPRTGKNAKEDPFTGVVVDCRGFPVKAALVPRVIDEDGEVVFGPAYVSRDHAVKGGMAAYARDLSEAQANPRVARNPLTVKGIRTAKTGESDIVISNADAARIRGTAKNLDLLQKCRVVIVVD